MAKPPSVQIRRHLKMNKSNRTYKLWKQITAWVKEFGEMTTLHGIPYVTRKNYHWIETLAWFVVLVCAYLLAVSLIALSWVRYNENPTVVSIEKNYRDWTVDFPAVTGCFVNRLNETSAHFYITEQWGIDPNSTEYTFYMSFLNALTNLTYNNLDEFNQFKSDANLTKLQGTDLKVIAQQMSKKMEYETTNDLNMDFYEVVTEMGLCYTYAGNVSYYLSLQAQELPQFDVKTCQYTGKPCDIRAEEFPDSMRFFFHWPYDIPDSSSPQILVEVEHDMDVTLTFEQMVTSQDVRQLRIKQRGCRYTDEPLPGDKFYSYGFCRMKCRQRLLKDKCGCLPHYYATDGEICDVKGLICVAEQKSEFLRVMRNATGCQCLPNCVNVDYNVDKVTNTLWHYPGTHIIILRWSISVENFSKTRTKRNIIFGTDDLLVSFGGTAALFLGCSVISFIEVGNFFILKWLWKIG